MSQDIVSDTLNQIMNAKRARKEMIVVKRHSKFLIGILDLMKRYAYIEDYKVEGRELRIEFKNLNECRAIKPRYNVQVSQIEKYIRRYLPARDFGIIIISTNKGIMTHQEAIEKKEGGSLIAFVY